MMTRSKDRRVAAILAFTGAVLPISGLHKFYLGQPRWGIVYLLLSWGSPIAKIASVVEGVWYLFQDREEFDRNFNSFTPLQESGVGSASMAPTAVAKSVEPIQVVAVADALRQLDHLRQDGLISEYEFEQKRRQLLDRVG